MKTSDFANAPSRVYATPGRKVVVRTGSKGRPKSGTLMANLYHKANLYARIVDVKGTRLLVGRNQVKVVL